MAEDDANLRRGIADLLSMEGFTCFAASDGEVALTLLRARAPHIAIIDVMMPKLDGLTVCRRIREQDPVLPILILSARDSEIDRVVGLEYGADDYLSKPFGPRELLARIRSLLRRAALCRTQPPADTRFTLGDIEVVTGELRAYRGANRFDLTARDVMLLKVLYDRKGRVVSRDDLFDLCWGRDHMPNSRALDQYVSALRKKIEIDPSNPQIIKTVHGFGYRFDV
ncbi:putative two-component response regulator [Hyphomicrobium denitrificans 1NES1]|uniref:Putative two-component response regulator n=1 Tax=Hyphomicrobium denitrificans 1NES1 TaxID=670307 RepID=N0B8S2_9HYPH|nr:putative two-component response regulator [Hyphomicrobium denitrificans 1NES1]